MQRRTLWGSLYRTVEGILPLKAYRKGRVKLQSGDKSDTPKLYFAFNGIDSGG